MTTIAEQCNAAIDLNAYRREQSCHNLIILLLPARLYTSQGGSCCVKPIAVLHLTVDIRHIRTTAELAMHLQRSANNIPMMICLSDS